MYSERYSGIYRGIVRVICTGTVEVLFEVHMLLVCEI